MQQRPRRFEPSHVRGGQKGGGGDRRARAEAVRFDVIEEPISGHENEPMITASGGRLFQPFAIVFIPMVEPSKRIPLRSAFGVTVSVSRPGIDPKPGV